MSDKSAEGCSTDKATLREASLSAGVLSGSADVFTSVCDQRAAAVPLMALELLAVHGRIVAEGPTWLNLGSPGSGEDVIVGREFQTELFSHWLQDTDLRSTSRKAFTISWSEEGAKLRVVGSTVISVDGIALKGHSQPAVLSEGSKVVMYHLDQSSESLRFCFHLGRDCPAPPKIVPWWLFLAAPQDGALGLKDKILQLPDTRVCFGRDELPAGLQQLLGTDRGRISREQLQLIPRLDGVVVRRASGRGCLMNLDGFELDEGTSVKVLPGQKLNFLKEGPLGHNVIFLELTMMREEEIKEVENAFRRSMCNPVVLSDLCQQ